MSDFESKCRILFDDIGDHKTMVLSTSLNDKVTSRMMSIVLIGGKFYFQTDFNFRKYKQIMQNSNVALCADNAQIEGICKQHGIPYDFPKFCELYREHFSVAYDLYSSLESERLFAVEPTYIQRWIYKNGKPFVECFDFINRIYHKISDFSNNT